MTLVGIDTQTLVHFLPNPFSTDTQTDSDFRHGLDKSCFAVKPCGGQQHKDSLSLLLATTDFLYTAEVLL